MTMVGIVMSLTGNGESLSCLNPFIRDIGLIGEQGTVL